MWTNLGLPWKPEMYKSQFCRGKLLFHISDRSGRWASKSKTCVPPFFSTKWETCKINIICIFQCWQTPKPLHNEEPTVSVIYKMLPLQNQEPVIAYPCTHIGCQKKGFGGPLGVLIMERNLLQVSNFQSFILLENSICTAGWQSSFCLRETSFCASRSLKLQLQSRQSGVPIFSC